jgi:hydroxypyruvate isomerase
MMFNEVDFLDRFGSAAAAGFKGVEFLLPYAYDVHQLGCRQIHCMARLKPRGVNGEQMHAAYIANLQFEPD